MKTPTPDREQIAGRIQEIIEDCKGTITAFQKWLRQRGEKALAETVRGWIPPASKWSWDRENKAWASQLSKRQSAADWEAVKLPGPHPLIRFCNLLNARADHILFGIGTAYRGGTRPPQEIAVELAAEIRRRLT